LEAGFPNRIILTASLGDGHEKSKEKDKKQNLNGAKAQEWGESSIT
jgi:hypothetical protein